MRNSKTTKELYDQIIQMTDIHSKPELNGEILIWKLYENAYVRAYCDSYDTCIDIIGKFGTTKVLMMPAPEGKGIIAGGAVRDVVELAGIKDITAKLYGSNNPVNCVKAAFEGLKALRSAEQIAALRGKTVDEIR